MLCRKIARGRLGYLPIKNRSNPIGKRLGRTYEPILIICNRKRMKLSISPIKKIIPQNETRENILL
jgi:hypothetical protein